VKSEGSVFVRLGKNIGEVLFYYNLEKTLHTLHTLHPHNYYKVKKKSETINPHNLFIFYHF
jgi:hypothetical protein